MNGRSSDITVPSDLLDAIGGQRFGGKLPSGGLRQLLSLGEDGRGDFTWGFRIYRTTYTKPNSDADFAKAIEVLNAYMRDECFSYPEGKDDSDEEDKPRNDDKASQQLWQRLRNDIVQDRELLEGASQTPAKITKLAQDWVHSHLGAKVYHSPRNRYFIVVDDEVIQHLLRLPMPPAYQSSVPAVYSVKVYDAEFGLDGAYFGDEESSDEDEDGSMCSEEDDGYRGWFWLPASMLVWLWFLEGNEAEAIEIYCWDDSWDGERRPMHATTSVRMMLPLKR